MKPHASAQNSRGIVDLRSDELSEHDSSAAPNEVTPNGSDPELASLNMRLGELEASLAKAQRRIERLLGERNQLSALLDKRDDQLQRLYRELAADRGVAFSKDSPRSESYALRGFVSGLTRKMISVIGATPTQRDFDKPSKAIANDLETPGSEGFKRPPLLANYKKAAPKAVLAVLTFGLDEGEIKNLLPVIERDSQASDMMPLLLTDHDAFEIFREQGIIFEYLPPAEDRQRFDCNLGWDLYIQRRLAIIRKKWQPARVIALGQVATDMLSLWQHSPFEEIPLPAAVKDLSAATT